MARASSYSGEYFAMREDIVESDLWEDWTVMRLYMVLCRWSQRSRPLGTVHFSYAMGKRALSGRVGSKDVEPGPKALRRALQVLHEAGLIDVPDAPWGTAGGRAAKRAESQAAAGARGGILVKVPNVGTSRARAARQVRGSGRSRGRGKGTGKAPRGAPQGVPPSGEREHARAHEGARASEAGPPAQTPAPPCADCALHGAAGSPGQVEPNPAIYGPGTPAGPGEFDRPLCAVHAYGGGRAPDAPLAGGAAARSSTPGAGLQEQEWEQELRDLVESAFLSAGPSTTENVKNGKDYTLRPGAWYLAKVRHLAPELFEQLELELGSSPAPGVLLRAAAPGAWEKAVRFTAKRWPALQPHRRPPYVQSAIADKLSLFLQGLPAAKPSKEA